MNNQSRDDTAVSDALNNLAKLDAWSEEPMLAHNAIPATPATVKRIFEIAAEQGVTTEGILSRALAALEAQSTR